jgi:hypothetical protein
MNVKATQANQIKTGRGFSQGILMRLDKYDGIRLWPNEKS